MWSDGWCVEGGSVSVDGVLSRGMVCGSVY